MADWASAAREWGASPTAILLRHAQGEHDGQPSVACMACTAHNHPNADVETTDHAQANPGGSPDAAA